MYLEFCRERIAFFAFHVPPLHSTSHLSINLGCSRLNLQWDVIPNLYNADSMLHVHFPNQ